MLSELGKKIEHMCADTHSNFFDGKNKSVEVADNWFRAGERSGAVSASTVFHGTELKYRMMYKTIWDNVIVGLIEEKSRVSTVGGEIAGGSFKCGSADCIEAVSHTNGRRKSLSNVLGMMKVIEQCGIEVESQKFSKAPNKLVGLAAAAIVID